VREDRAPAESGRYTQAKNMRAYVLIILVIMILSSIANAETQTEFKLPSGVEVKIVEAKFIASDFKIEGCNDSDTFCFINGRPPYGVAFGLPKTFLKNVTITYKDRSHSLETSDMFNAWGSRPIEYKDVIRYFGGNCYDKDNCQFRGLFSDAAGSYVAEWKIINGKSFRTVLTSSDDIIDLFMKKIDPPTHE
jgi:hypothetical protein